MSELYVEDEDDYYNDDEINDNDNDSIITQKKEIEQSIINRISLISVKVLKDILNDCNNQIYNLDVDIQDASETINKCKKMIYEQNELKKKLQILNLKIIDVIKLRTDNDIN